MAEIRERIEKVKQDIAAACKRAGRKQGSVEILAATKMVPPNLVEQAIQNGITHIGENRVQEAAEKFPLIPSLSKATKHFIGVIQSNKIRHIAGMFDWVQSIDSMKHAKLLDAAARDKGKVMNCLVEINIAGEETKAGIMPEDLGGFMSKLLKLRNLRVRGLMAMPPLMEPEKERPYFKRLKELAESQNLTVLSMGTSHDYVVAVEEGSTMVRLGTAIFGPRDKL